jgi:hypothetical protein
MADELRRQLVEGEKVSVVNVLDACGSKVEIVGALGGGEQKLRAAAAPSPLPFMPPPPSSPKQHQALPSDMHLSVPRLIDAFLQPPAPHLLQQQQPHVLPRRLSADEHQQHTPRSNGSGTPLAAAAGSSPLAHGSAGAGREGGVVTRRPSADGAVPGAARPRADTDSPLATQRDACAAAAIPAFRFADQPVITPGAPPSTPSAWSLSIMREGGTEGGVALVQVQLMIGDNLIGAPKGQQEEQGLVVRLRR